MRFKHQAGSSPSSRASVITMSALKIACSLYFFFLPKACTFAPAAVRSVHNQHPYRIIVDEKVHQHQQLCALPLLGDMSESFDGREGQSTNTSITKPRLATVVENILQWLIKHILLSQCSSLKVNMNAESNKAILKGNVSKISISARDSISRFKLLSFRKLDLYGVNLHLGYLPFVLPVLPFFLWRFRQYIQSTIITVFLLRITGCLDVDKFRKQLGSIKERIRRYIGSPRLPCISYSMAISSSDISNSLLLRFWLRNILQSLVQNSVIGAAATLGDAAKQSVEAERRRMQNGIPLLPGSAAALPNLSSQDLQQQQGLTSALLSATSFELTNAGFMDGKVVFDAKAVLPRNENGETNSLQFCIRAKLAPTAILETDDQPTLKRGQQEIQNAIGFLQPECRLATNPLYAPFGVSSILNNLVPNMIPEHLWLPFGIGVSVNLGNKSEIYRAEVKEYKEGGCICRIDGCINTNKY